MKEALERTEELDVDLTEATTEEELEQIQDKQREELEQKKMIWEWTSMLIIEYRENYFCPVVTEEQLTLTTFSLDLWLKLAKASAVVMFNSLIPIECPR